MPRREFLEFSEEQEKEEKDNQEDEEEEEEKEEKEVKEESQEKKEVKPWTREPKHLDMPDIDAIIAAASAILDQPREHWQAQRQRLLDDCLDVTGLIVQLAKEFGQG